MANAYNFVDQDLLLSADKVTQFTNALAIFKAYTNSGSPCPPDVVSNRKDAWDELTAIAEGKRPNLPKIADPALQSRAGVVGSSHRLRGRMSGELDCTGGGWV